MWSHTVILTHYLSDHPPMKLWEGNVYTGVSLSFCSGGIPMWPLFMVHSTSLYRALSPTPTPDIRHGTPSPTQLVTSGGHHWRSVQTCSLEKPHTGTDIWWPKHVWLASGRYASSENAFLLFKVVTIIFSLISLPAFHYRSLLRTLCNIQTNDNVYDRNRWPQNLSCKLKKGKGQISHKFPNWQWSAWCLPRLMLEWVKAKWAHWNPNDSM